jgi:hypothetical protein
MCMAIKLSTKVGCNGEFKLSAFLDGSACYTSQDRRKRCFMPGRLPVLQTQTACF